MSSDPSDTAPRPSLLDRFIRNPTTGEVVVVQPPNLPLAVFLVAAVVRRLTHPAGTVGTVVSGVAAVALAAWAILELLHGNSPFRRVLGGVVLVVMLVGAVAA